MATIIVSQALSQVTDKLPNIHNNTSWLFPFYANSNNNNNKDNAVTTTTTTTAMQQQQQDGDSFLHAYRPLSEAGSCSPRYSMSPPPSYEAATTTATTISLSDVDNKGFTNKLSTLWKRASFSSFSAAATEDDINMTTTTAAMIDKKQMDHAITLLNVASDMMNTHHNSNSQESQQMVMAIDLYMMGLDKLMSALPLATEANVKVSLERKLVEIKERYQMNLVSSLVVDDDLLFNKKNNNDRQDEEATTRLTTIRTHISNLVVHAAVLSAVALKKSPIPDAMTNMMNFAVDSISTMDEKHQIRKRTWDLAATGVAKAMEMDRQFEIHQIVTEAVYTGLAAFVKAGLAYAETSGPSAASTN